MAKINSYPPKSKRLGFGLLCLLTVQLIFIYGNLGAEQRPAHQAISKKQFRGYTRLASSDDIIELAKTDHLKLIETMMSHYDNNIFDYTGTFDKQEKIKSRLFPPQTVDFKFREKPFSISMQ